MKELDTLFTRYADASLDGLDAAAMDSLEALLEVPEAVLLDIMTGKQAAMDATQQALVNAVRKVSGLEPVGG